MIQILDKKDCCGCSACVQKCPKQCISLKEDNEGFLYPIVDKETCIDCGLCEKVCPVLHQREERKPLKVYAAKNNDEEIRRQSSSGGIFTLLAEKVIQEGGVVFGARFDENWEVKHDYAETIEGLAAFRGSKYVQSRIENSYKEAENFLKLGRKVLFSGTPCQISGLKHFLRKDYDNLFTVDFVCHGVPSPKIWKRYLLEITKTSFIKSMCVSPIYRGLNNFSFSVDYTIDDPILIVSQQYKKNTYVKAFLKDLILRPSCHSCVVKKCSSKSDMTIADFWGIWDIKPDLFDDKGTSLILINTNHAKKFILFEKIALFEVSFEESIKYNPALLRSSIPHIKRELFWKNLNKTRSLTNLVSKCCAVKGILAFKICVKSFFHFLKCCEAPYIKEFNTCTRFDILSISFRNKKNSWRKYEFIIELKGVKE